MTKIPHDEILEGLYKLRIRESEKLKTVLELYDLETHQKKLGPDYHRLKTMVKRSIKQEIRNKNFGSRNGNFETNPVVKNQGTKQRVQRILGDCWQWETNGQCVKGDNCSFRHDINRRGKVTPSNPTALTHFCSPPFVCPARIDGLTRPLTCAQAFGTDIRNQRSRVNGSVIGSSISWATSTVKLSSRQQPERRHDESMIMPHNTLGPSVSGRLQEQPCDQCATVFMWLENSSFHN